MSSVVTLQPAAVIYREEQYFDWRIYSFIALGRDARRAWRSRAGASGRSNSGWDWRSGWGS